MELYWLRIGVPLAWLSNIKPQKYLSKIEPDARCIVAPTDEECFPGIAIKFRAQQTLRDGMHQVRLIAELHVVKQSRINVNESLGRRGDGNRFRLDVNELRICLGIRRELDDGVNG